MYCLAWMPYNVGLASFKRHKTTASDPYLHTNSLPVWVGARVNSWKAVDRYEIIFRHALWKQRFWRVFWNLPQKKIQSFHIRLVLGRMMLAFERYPCLRILSNVVYSFVPQTVFYVFYASHGFYFSCAGLSRCATTKHGLIYIPFAHIQCV